MNADEIVSEMLSKDAFSQWLGLEVDLVAPGVCSLKMTIRQEMLNGFGIAHGGITYALADSALAFASNSRGLHAVSIETGIAHHKPLKVGECIFAKAKEIHLGNKIGTYSVEVTNNLHELVATFKGTVYRTGRVWETI